MAGARVVRISSPSAAAPFRIGIQHVRDSAAFSSEVRGQRVSDWSLPAVEPDEWIEADAVVLATGGLSFPRTGSDGVGYALARSLGHTIVAPVPALTPLVASDPLCTIAQGVTMETELTLWVDGRRSVSVQGSLLITHFGYSGPVALDLSRHWLRAEGQSRRVTASLVPGSTRETLQRDWIDAVARTPLLTARRFLAERVPDRIAVHVCGEGGVDVAVAIGQVDRSRRAAVIERMVERELPVSGTLGYEKAEVTAGGVAVEEVDPATMESRVAPGLFLCGEILDVEGRLGGFNFQWSWSSGTVAGKAAGSP